MLLKLSTLDVIAGIAVSVAAGLATVAVCVAVTRVFNL
jgi:hypothetical protein